MIDKKTNRRKDKDIFGGITNDIRGFVWNHFCNYRRDKR